MRTVTPIAYGDGFALERVVVRARVASWFQPEVPSGYRIMLVRRGVFRARVGGRTLLADPTVAYAGGPAQEQSIAHRVGADDVCTALVMSASFVAELVHGAPVPAVVPVPADLAVAHRLVSARARQGADPFELAELTTRLAGRLLTAPVPPPRTTRRGSTEAARRALAEAARELLAGAPGGLGLREVARRLACSPYHLSRVFHEQTGTTLTGYRNRVRVHRALDAIEAGRTGLADLAADLGFADHAHLTRTVRDACGHTPRALRRLLAAPD